MNYKTISTIEERFRLGNCYDFTLKATDSGFALTLFNDALDDIDVLLWLNSLGALCQGNAVRHEVCDALTPADLADWAAYQAQRRAAYPDYQARDLVYVHTYEFRLVEA